MPSHRGSFSRTAAVLAFSAFTQAMARAPWTSSSQRYGSVVSALVACAEARVGKKAAQQARMMRDRMAETAWETAGWMGGSMGNLRVVHRHGHNRSPRAH